MGKRKRAGDDSVLGETDSSETVLSSDVITSASLCSTSKDEYDVWLVRKPIRVCLFISFRKG